jgi:hypothetical protein
MSGLESLDPYRIFMRQLDAIGCKAPPSPGAILFSGFFLYFFFLPFVTGAALVLDPADDRKVVCEALETDAVCDALLLDLDVSASISRPKGAKLSMSCCRSAASSRNGVSTRLNLTD